MICPRCGAEMPILATFCTQCGQQFATAHPKPGAAEGPQRLPAGDAAATPGVSLPPNPYGPPPGSEPPDGAASGGGYARPGGYTAPPSGFTFPAAAGAVAPPRGPRNRVQMWAGLGLMILSVALVICSVVLVLLGARDTATTPDALRSTQLGLILCSCGLFLLLGVPGGVLFFMGRRT